jgi:hypothetical protein
MDPLSLLALAQGSYAALKAGIAAGRELQGMAADLGSLFDSVAAITRAAADPPKGSLLAGKSAEQMAMEAYSAKATADDLMASLRNEFVGAYGLAAWDEVVAHTTRIKKDIKAAEIQAANERAEMLDGLAFWSSVIMGLIFVGSLIVIGILVVTHR